MLWKAYIGFYVVFYRRSILKLLRGKSPNNHRVGTLNNQSKVLTSKCITL